jgi:hypothetical protein
MVSATVEVEPPSAVWGAAASAAMLVARVGEGTGARSRSATSLAQDPINHQSTALEPITQPQAEIEARL